MLTAKQWERLARLNREVAGKLVGKAATPAHLKREPRPAFREPLSLDEAIPGTTRNAAGGSYYVAARRIAELCADGELEQKFRGMLVDHQPGIVPEKFHRAEQPLLLASPERIVFLDIETCGFTGVPLFLVGLMNYQGGGLVLRQFLARNYAEERPLLCGLREELRDFDVVVTFNGKSFDLPVVLDRSIVHGIFDFPTPPEHVDLLHAARRRWKNVLPDCRLQTLERRICGRLRIGDIPSSEIPAVYHAFVRSTDAADPRERARCLNNLRAVVHHNALDLVTMAELVVHLLI